MSDAATESTDRLIRRLEAEARKYRTQRDDARTALAERDKSIEKLTKERDDAVKDRDKFSGDLTKLQDDAKAAPTKDRQRIAELEKSIRDRAHRDAFDKAADGKIRKDAREAAWKLSDYKAEGDEPDAAKMDELVGSLITAHAYLKESDQGSEPGGQQGRSMLRGHQNPESGPTRRHPATDRGPAPKPRDPSQPYQSRHPNGTL